MLVLLAGLERAPRCAACVALGLGLPPAAMLRHLRGQVLRRACWLVGWERASACEADCPVLRAAGAP